MLLYKVIQELKKINSIESSIDYNSLSSLPLSLELHADPDIHNTILSSNVVTATINNTVQNICEIAALK